MKLLYQVWQANDILEWTIAAAVAAGALVVLVALRFGAIRALKALSGRSGSVFCRVAADVVATTRMWLLLPVAIYAGSTALELPGKAEQLVDGAAIIAVMLQAALWTSRCIDAWLDRGVARQRVVDGGVVTALELIGFAGRAVVWGLTLLIVLSHLGFNITALVAGLGVGGVAVALAVQNILGDLFASLSIVLDKPFVVGDFIVVDSLRGTVERVGIKTTRLRSLDGELLVFSNTDLLKSRIRNFKRMYDRRVEFVIGVVYCTPLEKLRLIPGWLGEMVKAQPKARLDRAHFKEYGDSALKFEIVYYVLDPDYNVYMDVHQSINLAIYEKFAHEGVEFAFPTRTVHLVYESTAAEAR